MRIYSMTATFGKLEHETLTLKPGLNVIEAPNEWGKSTWCAFLINMLYGIDTRAKTTKTALADKERYAPWSGAPMAGRIDLNWNGKDITIERRTQGRLIFGEFSAYETATGLEIPELNATNCGSVLLGVERSVFTRAGFLKLADLPVTPDDALRRRLNSLVTTGDESGAADKLQQALKDLKNKCRYNRSGLLPQAENQRDYLENQLHELDNLQQQTLQLRQQLSGAEQRLSRLENHKDALLYAAAQEDLGRVAQAQQLRDEAERVYTDLQQHCEGLPSSQEASCALSAGRDLQQQQKALQTQLESLPPLPEAPQRDPRFCDLEPADAPAAAQADWDKLQALQKQKRSGSATAWIIGPSLALACIAVALLGVILGFGNLLLYVGAGIGAVIAVAAAAVISALSAKTKQRQIAVLCKKYADLSPDNWVETAKKYAAEHKAYADSTASTQALRRALNAQQDALTAQAADYAGEDTLEQTMDRWQQILASHSAMENAQKEFMQAQSHLETLQAMVKTVQPPKLSDDMTENEAETDHLLQSVRFEQRQLQQRLGQYQGRAEALGDPQILRTQLSTVQRRIHKLEDTYSALELAQKALSAASSELQRRFAPRISKRAQELFQQLTQGRYDRLTLSSDLSIQMSTHDEDALRSSQWRSDGTVDQLYLALRMAVSEELTPDAPFVLDDALVRFDDQRLAIAMDILKDMGENKQVILFTCQGRESKLQGEHA